MISEKELKKTIEDDSAQNLEKLKTRSKELTCRYFGRTVALYAPLYLSNYCDSGCVYCGFNASRKISRNKLSRLQVEREAKLVFSSGIQSLLLLTGGSRRHAPPAYIKASAQIARRYFPSVGIEVYPMEENEYRLLYEAGVDSVTIYQETYNRKNYRALHPYGKKSDYAYRYGAPERIARAGMRSLSMGVLLGLGDVAGDIHSLFRHLEEMQKNYPGVEYSLSFPRIVGVAGSGFKPREVSDKTLIKLICLARINFPRFGINLSTRESAAFRDLALEAGVTRISAASRTSVGGYGTEAGGDTQFDVQDKRTVKEITRMLKNRNLDPVFTEWRSIGNEP